MVSADSYRSHSEYASQSFFHYYYAGTPLAEYIGLSPKVYPAYLADESMPIFNPEKLKLFSGLKCGIPRVPPITSSAFNIRSFEIITAKLASFITSMLG